MSDTDAPLSDSSVSDDTISETITSDNTASRSAESCVNRWLSSEPGLLLELAINKAIARDPVAQRRLAKLAGRSLLLTLTLPKIQLGVEIDSVEIEGVEAGSDGAGVSPVTATISLVAAQQLSQPDCEIEGAPSDLLALMLDPQQAFDNRVQLRGNTQLANQLRDIAQQLDLDWGGLLGDRIGDVAAQLVLKLLRQGRLVLQENSNNLLDDLDNWLHEEIRVQPCVAELDGFYDQIDQLKLDVDRLQARLERLEQE